MTPRALWTVPTPLLLASTSPTRRALLESSGLPVDTESPSVDERAVEAQAEQDSLDPSALAIRLAAEKALAVSRRRPGRIVVGADQVLEADHRPLHKAVDHAEARAKLLALAGRTHHLRSAAAVARDGQIVETLLDSASLTVRPLEAAKIDLYLDLAGTGILGSVGCYQLEGFGIHLFDRVEGDHSTILGLPLLPLLRILRRLGCLAL